MANTGERALAQGPYRPPMRSWLPLHVYSTVSAFSVEFPDADLS